MNGSLEVNPVPGRLVLLSRLGDRYCPGGFGGGVASVEIGESALGIGDISVASVDWYYIHAAYLSLLARTLDLGTIQD